MIKLKKTFFVCALSGTFVSCTLTQNNYRSFQEKQIVEIKEIFSKEIKSSTSNVEKINDSRITKIISDLENLLVEINQQNTKKNISKQIKGLKQIKKKIFEFFKDKNLKKNKIYFNKIKPLIDIIDREINQQNPNPKLLKKILLPAILSLAAGIIISMIYSQQRKNKSKIKHKQKKTNKNIEPKEQKKANLYSKKEHPKPSLDKTTVSRQANEPEYQKSLNKAELQKNYPGNRKQKKESLNFSFNEPPCELAYGEDLSESDYMIDPQNAGSQQEFTFDSLSSSSSNDDELSFEKLLAETKYL